MGTLEALALRYIGYIIVGAIGIGLIYGAYLHYEHLKEQADLVPGLQKQVADDELKAQAIQAKLNENHAIADAYDRLLSVFQSFKASQISTLRAGLKNANINTKPECLPTDTERKLFNDTVNSVINAGQNPSGTSVPTNSGTVPGKSTTAPVHGIHDLWGLFNRHP